MAAVYSAIWESSKIEIVALRVKPTEYRVNNGWLVKNNIKDTWLHFNP